MESRGRQERLLRRSVFIVVVDRLVIQSEVFRLGHRKRFDGLAHSCGYRIEKPAAAGANEG